MSNVNPITCYYGFSVHSITISTKCVTDVCLFTPFLRVQEEKKHDEK